MKHSFEVKIATEYGILEAILLDTFYYWTLTNKRHEKHFYDGRYWIYNSIKAFTEWYPYSSKSTIERALNHLENEGLLVTGNYNQKAFDKTKWYALTEKALWILEASDRFAQNDEIDLLKMMKSFTQNDETNTNSYNTVQTNNNTICTEQNATVPKDVFITLSLNNNTEYEITSELLKEFKDLYPAVDVEQELRNMKAWCLSNPKKRKTKSGILRFVNSWLSKEQNKPHIDTRPKRIVGGELSDEWNGGIGN